MISHKFFFYNKMKNINNLERVSEKYNIEEAYILINDIDLKKNTIILNDKNDKKLYGNYVEFFEKDLAKIVLRINKIFEKKNCKHCLDREKKNTEFLKKYHCLNKVLEYIPKGFFDKRYKIFKVSCYSKKKKILSVNLII